MSARRIIGAGGGDGKGGGVAGSAQVEAADSLRSKAFARVLDLLSEGEIEGLVDGAKSIYLDGTPLQNDDGSYNFTGTAWVSRNGTQSQGYIPGFPSVENTTTVGVEVKAATPVTRQFTNPNLNAVRVTVGVPSLSVTDTTNGNINGTSVGIAIDVQTNGGGFVRQDLGGRATISGKTSSRYQRDYRIPLTGTGPWDVRVVRLTADSASAALQNKTFWETATEIIDSKLRYPNSAIVGVTCDASQFNSIPTRAYDVKLLRVRVPTNYDPVARTYTGSWDGNFKIAWTDNPAWCFYDLVTNDRYGLGAFVDASQVDKWSLYAIGKYCDALVPDGFGGQEPRFTCNIYLQTKQEAYKLINDMAAIFRGMAFWSSGSITAVQDAPADAAFLFSPANVIDGTFTYSGSSAKARHTVALVTWNDPDDLYRQKVEYVEDTAGIARFGVVTTEVAAIGCTSRGQANRVGRWLLFTERLESEVVTYKTGLEGAIARPGQIIKIADPARAGVRFGGRLVSATTSSAVLDAPVTLTAGETYLFSAVKADGTVQETGVTHSGGTLSTLVLSPALAEAPTTGTIWLLASAAVDTQTFRVLAVTENDKHEFEVSALAHNPGKYDAIELGLTLEPRSYSILTAIPATPSNLVTTDTLYRTTQGTSVRLSASWSPVPTATSYAISYQQQGGNSNPEVMTSLPNVDIADITEGIYTIKVYALNALGVRSTLPATVQYQVLGKTAPPENVTGFVVARNGNTLNFTWRHVSDVDLDHYEIRQGSSWNTGVPIGATVSNAFSWSAPRGGSFMIKAVDTIGNYSAGESVIVAPDISGINVVVASSESARNWSGTTVNALVLGLVQAMQWSDLGSWDSAGLWGDTTFAGGVALNGSQPWSAYTQPWANYGSKPWVFLDPVSSGSYTTAPIDIGFVATSSVYLENLVETLQAQGAWSTFTQPWSEYAAPDWTWQGRAGGIAALFEISTSTDGITYSQWQQFTPGAYTFRYVKIRATLTTNDLAVIPYLTRMIVRIDVPDRVVHFQDVSVPLAGVTLSFTPTFVGVQTVQVTLQSAASGDKFTVTGKSNTGVTVKVFDSAGTAKTGLVDVDVFGYGERY